MVFHKHILFGSVLFCYLVSVFLVSLLLYLILVILIFISTMSFLRLVQICRQQNKCKLKAEILSGMGREHCGKKGEIAGYKHFLLFPQCFPKDSFSGSLNVRGLCSKGLTLRHDFQWLRVRHLLKTMVGKESDANQHCLFFLWCFLSFQKQFFNFSSSSLVVSKIWFAQWHYGVCGWVRLFQFVKTITSIFTDWFIRSGRSKVTVMLAHRVVPGKPSDTFKLDMYTFLSLNEVFIIN